MPKSLQAKLIALSLDPNVGKERLSREEQIYSMDPKLFSFYRISGRDVREIIGPHAYVNLNPRSKEYRQALEEAGDF